VKDLAMNASRYVVAPGQAALDGASRNAFSGNAINRPPHPATSGCI